MKTLLTLIFVLAQVVAVVAQDKQQLEVKFVVINHPADVLVTKESWDQGALLKQPGVEVLQLPPVTVRNGRLAQVKTVDLKPVPGAGDAKDGANYREKVETGVILNIQPTLRDDVIEFSATATIRKYEGIESVNDSTAAAQFTSQEYYLGGKTKNNETLIVPSKTSAQGKRITFILTITKV